MSENSLNNVQMSDEQMAQVSGGAVVIDERIERLIEEHGPGTSESGYKIGQREPATDEERMIAETIRKARENRQPPQVDVPTRTPEEIKQAMDAIFGN